MSGLRITIALLALAAGGCTTVVPVIPKLVACEIPPAQLQAACAAPGPLAAGMTYSDVIGVAIADRRNLSLCAEQNRFLVQSVAACNAAIAEHNRKLDEINADLSKRR
jgi:hypothetical protein